MGTAALLLAVVASRQAGLAARATAIENRLLDELDRWAGTRALILDLEATTRLDTTSVDVLIDLVDELNRRDITLYLARVLHPVNGVLQRSGFLDLLGDDHSWHSISQCVRAARRDLGLKHESATSPDGPSDNDTTTIGAAAPTSDSDAAAAERHAAMAEIEILEEEQDGRPEPSTADPSCPSGDVAGGPQR